MRNWKQRQVSCEMDSKSDVVLLHLLPDKYKMRLHEIQPNTSPTPEQMRIKSLELSAQKSRENVQAERDRQRKQRDDERKRKLVSTTNLQSPTTT